MIWGMDYLCGAKYPDLIIRNHPIGYAARLFWNLDGIGPAKNVIEALAHTDKAPLLGTHGLWKNDHHFTLSDLNECERRAHDFNSLAQKFPQIKWEYSPICEHKITDIHILDSILSACQKAAPDCTIVNTPIGNGVYSSKFKGECHGDKAQAPNGRYNFSFDGTSAVDSDAQYLKGRHSKSEVFYFWDPLFNLRFETNDTTPRPQRHILPTAKDIQGLVFLTTNRMDAFIHLDSHTLYKSHSEVHEASHNSENYDSRSNHPVIITPHNSDHIEFRLASGEVVAKAPKYKDKYIDGRTRYYADQWGYEIAQKAIQKSGGPHARLFCGNVDLGTVNPGFRTGK